MNYLVAVLEDRIQAESAYSALEKKDIPMDNVAILGKGYQSADEYGLIDPAEEAWKQIQRMAFWLIPFGFGAGFIFNSITGITIFQISPLGNHIVGGILGALSGAMGAFFVGGGAGIAFGAGDAVSYRNRLNAGKYLVVVRGPEKLIRQATEILRPFRPENIQGYKQ